MLNKKGFTLIELLVVIAVLGILASVVLVAINPGERIAEARDSGTKNSVGQMATALEAYYTNNLGSYTGATQAALTTTGGYLKQMPPGVDAPVIGTGATNAGRFALVTSTTSMTAKSNQTKSPGGTSAFWVYATFNGKTYACNTKPVVADIVNAATGTWVDAAPATCNLAP